MATITQPNGRRSRHAPSARLCQLGGWGRQAHGDSPSARSHGAGRVRGSSSQVKSTGQQQVYEAASNRSTRRELTTCRVYERRSNGLRAEGRRHAEWPPRRGAVDVPSLYGAAATGHCAGGCPRAESYGIVRGISNWPRGVSHWPSAVRVPSAAPSSGRQGGRRRTYRAPCHRVGGKGGGGEREAGRQGPSEPGPDEKTDAWSGLVWSMG